MYHTFKCNAMHGDAIVQTQTKEWNMTYDQIKDIGLFKNIIEFTNEKYISIPSISDTDMYEIMYFIKNSKLTKNYQDDVQSLITVLHVCDFIEFTLMHTYICQLLSQMMENMSYDELNNLYKCW
jgi:hypothetical protein